MHYLYQIQYGYVCAGIVVDGDSQCIIAAAPILSWMWGKRMNWVGRWVKKKNGTLELVAKYMPHL